MNTRKDSKNILANGSVQTLIASLFCIVLGLVVGYIVLFMINSAGAGKAITAILRGIIDQYLTTVKPMHYLYVEPTRSKADIVINSGKNDVAFDLFVSKIGQLLKELKK